MNRLNAMTSNKLATRANNGRGIFVVSLKGISSVKTVKNVVAYWCSSEFFFGYYFSQMLGTR
ncbi:hypothetical protein ACFOEK_10455 [Litoribrevibacter euphylliae]|uniref:Uncharacterized protein n=2 Tax=Litoribrevibacter euphylliae TaxID=1834034 RepID=A0ABV7HIB9_9GAMM